MARGQPVEEPVAGPAEPRPPDEAAERGQDPAPELRRAGRGQPGEPGRVLPQPRGQPLAEVGLDRGGEGEPPRQQVEEFLPELADHHPVADEGRDGAGRRPAGQHGQVDLPRDDPHRQAPGLVEEPGEEAGHPRVPGVGDGLAPPDPGRPVEDDRAPEVAGARLRPDHGPDRVHPPLAHPVVQAAEGRVEAGDRRREGLPSRPRPRGRRPEPLRPEPRGDPVVADEPGELRADRPELAEERPERRHAFRRGAGRQRGDGRLDHRLVREPERELDDLEDGRVGHAEPLRRRPLPEAPLQGRLAVGPPGAEPQAVARDREPLLLPDPPERVPDPARPEEREEPDQAGAVRPDQVGDPPLPVRVGERHAELRVRRDEAGPDQVEHRDRVHEREAEPLEPVAVPLGRAREPDQAAEGAVPEPVDEDLHDAVRDRALVLDDLVHLVEQDVLHPAPLQEGLDRVRVEPALPQGGAEGREGRVGRDHDDRRRARAPAEGLELGRRPPEDGAEREPQPGGRGRELGRPLPQVVRGRDQDEDRLARREGREPVLDAELADQGLARAGRRLDHLPAVPVRPVDLEGPPLVRARVGRADQVRVGPAPVVPVAVAPARQPRPRPRRTRRRAPGRTRRSRRRRSGSPPGRASIAPSPGKPPASKAR